MAELGFLPSRHRSWSAYREGERTVHATGWADTGSAVVKAEALARHVGAQLETEMPFAEVVNGLNGNFAVAVIAPGTLHLGVDAVRSIPLFYRREGQLPVASDDIRCLRREEEPMDDRSAVEYETAGYVTGSHTLFSEISGLQAGECRSWPSPQGCRTGHRYYRYLCSYDADSSPDELCDAFDDVLMGAFGRSVESFQGRQVVIPLSGGLDSRLVASMLKRCDYDNVLCLSYGVPGNQESARSSAVAEALGYPWMQVPYPRDVWRGVVDSSEMRDYLSFAANGVSMPFYGDWPALKALRDNVDVAKDAVLMPGHTGDFICGGHLKYLFDPIWDEQPPNFSRAMVKKHYSLWEDVVDLPSIRAVVERRLHEALLGFSADTDEDFARMYEYWEWQERQAKYVINAVRSYEFFGYSWRIPLWDRGVMEFWRRVPIALKMDKYLYRRYLSSHDPMQLFENDVPAGVWNRSRTVEPRAPATRTRVTAFLNPFAPLSALVRRAKQLRRHLREYARDPLALAHAYSKYRYVLLEPSKRNSLAVLVRDFLRREYGLELSALRSRFDVDKEEYARR